MTLRETLFEYLRENHRRSYKGIEEAREVDPAQFDAIAEQFLTWATRARGVDALPSIADAFVRFSGGVNLAQARYELNGEYENKSFEDCRSELYSQRDSMDDYLWGVYLTNFLWAHHMDLSLFFRDRFIARLPKSAEIVEIAPGHGGWGVWALHNRPDASLAGFDISPSSIVIASSIAEAAGVADRASYQERDALDLDALPAESADALICSFLVEHLEEPDKLFAVVHHLLRPKQRAYLAGALTAAQTDHIYEFRRESELVAMCEAQGLRVVETLSVAPRRTLKNARFLPRSMGMIVEKFAGEIW
jgi:2-polyprenyl-3-methyl-5-hydroxy-6-metoxy-1,4-benzoquinol methylase